MCWDRCLFFELSLLSRRLLIVSSCSSFVRLLVVSFAATCKCMWLLALTLLVFLCSLGKICSTSPPGGNQVDGLPPASSCVVLHCVVLC